jgi:hypothetical protein
VRLFETESHLKTADSPLSLQQRPQQQNMEEKLPFDIYGSQDEANVDRETPSLFSRPKKM